MGGVGENGRNTTARSERRCILRSDQKRGESCPGLMKVPDVSGRTRPGTGGKVEAETVPMRITEERPVGPEESQGTRKGRRKEWSGGTDLVKGRRFLLSVKSRVDHWTGDPVTGRDEKGEST